MRRTRGGFAAFAKGAWLAAFLACLGFAALAPSARAQTSEAAPGQPQAPAQAPAPIAAPPALSALDAAASRDLDAVDVVLKAIDTALSAHDISDAALQDLREKASPLILQVQTDVDHLVARLAAVKARLDQLGPAPDAKAPQVTKERLQQQQEYETVDALVKRAKLLLVQAQQTNARIAARQHAKFTHSLFERNASLFDPQQWLNIGAETPHNFKLARTAIGDWVQAVDAKLTFGPALTFWASVVILLAIYRPLAIFSRRLLLRQRDDIQPSRFRKIAAAWWVALIIAGFPLLVLLILTGLLHAFQLFDHQRQPVVFALARAVAYVSFAAGLGAALFAPTHPNWRIVSLTTRSCKHALRAIVAVSVLLALSHLIGSLGDATGADAAYLAAIRGTMALFIAITIIVALWRAGTYECGSEDILGPRLDGTRDWYGILRFLHWAAAVAILVALAIGYLRLAQFIAEQIYWIGGVIFIAVMASILLEESIAAGCRSDAPFGRALMATAGLHADSIDQIAILLTGAGSVAIVIAAALVILAPWGIQSSDLPSYFRAAFFGFHVGDITVSLSSIVIALAIFFAGFMATRAVERWLDTQFLPHTHLDVGLRNAIKTSFGYVGFILALSFALTYLGLNFEKLAIVAGALSVGIGFGLQSIVNNFVSGLIILWERTIRVGDWIVVGTDEGVVSRINVRATEISTFDRAAVVIPNANLVAGVVKNYVRTDRIGRILISVPVNAAANPETARDILLSIAHDQEAVLPEPAPQVVFSSITASAFNFDLYCFIADVGTLGSIKSQLNFEIYRRFKEAKLFDVPPPASVVTLEGLEKIEPLFNRAVAANGLGKDKPGS